MATEKQIKLINDLLASRDHGLTNPVVSPTMSTRDASVLIDRLFSCPKKPYNTDGALPVGELSTGCYWAVDGSIARVQPSHSSGRLYAKKLDLTSKTFVYAKGLLYHLKARMTLDEAQSFGIEHGFCCVCTRLLTNPESVKNGIGPICASKV